MTDSKNEDLYYILYVSQAKRPMSEDELSGLLEVSRRNNIRDGITGLLLYKLWRTEKRANFLQLLEGPREAVTAAYEKIKKDSRHHTIISLEQGELSERNFTEWAMGFKNLESEDLKSFPGVRDVDIESFDPDHFHEQIKPALESMKLFYEFDD